MGALTVVWALLAAVTYAGLAWLDNWTEHFATFLLLFGLGWIACWGASRSRMDVRVILIGAVLFRAALVPVAPTLSDDIFRYVWEGRVQAHGFNPFVLAPSAPELVHLRDADWARINHPDASAIYPPAAQLVFRTLASWGGVTLFKAAFCMVDIALVVFLARTLRRRNVPSAQLALYAWNPLVIVEIAGSGHLEPLAILPLVAAILWVQRRPTAAWLALAWSLATKYVGALLLPLVLRERRAPLVGVALAIVALALVSWPYADAGLRLFDSLWLYTEKWRYNDIVFAALATLSGAGSTPGASSGSLWTAKLMAALVLIALVAVSVWRRPPLERGALWVLSALVLLSPTLHPWYLLWIVAFLPLAPHPALFAWSGSVVLAYWFLYPVELGPFGELGPFDKSSWIPRSLEITPVLVAWLLPVARKRLARSTRSSA